MQFNPDDIIYWQYGLFELNATLVWTWAVLIMSGGFAWAVKNRLTTGLVISRWQAFSEALVLVILEQVREETREVPEKLLPFIASLFIFISLSNLLGVIPGVYPPTASLSTASALAFCVFIAVPAFGISKLGVSGYLKHYISPNPLMLPFNIIGELSRTMALAIRLFGNIMSGSLIIAILLSLSPLFFPVVMQAFGLLIGFIQAYVFAVLALVYIASAVRVIQEDRADSLNQQKPSQITDHHG